MGGRFSTSAVADAEEDTPLQGRKPASPSSSAAFEMSGASGDTFFHPNKDFAKWRLERHPLRKGEDWELEVLVVPAAVAQLDEFAAPLITHREEARRDAGFTEEDDAQQAEESAAEATRLVNEGSSPADLLWRVSGFGSLTWDWRDWPDPDPAAAAGVAAAAPTAVDEAAQSLLISVELPPTAHASEVYTQGQLAAWDQIAQIGAAAKRHGLMEAEDMKELIKQDCDKLLGFVHKSGTFGALALPAGLQPITEFALYAADDASVEAIFATASHCYHLKWSQFS